MGILKRNGLSANGGRRIAIVVVCAIVLVAGLYFYSQKQTGVPGVDALTPYTSLGILMSAFLFFEAVGAGSLLFAGLTDDRERSLALSLIGLVGVVCAGIAVVADVGTPLRLWQLWITPVAYSPIFLDIVFMTLGVIFAVLLIVGLKTGNALLVKAGRAACGAIGVIMPLGTSLIFTGMSAALGFESLLEIAYFLLQSVMAGSIVSVGVGLVRKRDSSRERKIAVALLACNALLRLSEMALCFYRTDTTMEATKAIVFGQYAPIFWITLIAGVVVPCVLLAARKFMPISVFLVLFGAFGSKVVFILKGNLFPYIDFGEGVRLPMLQPPVDGIQAIYPYVPTVGEWAMVAAVFAVAVAALALTSSIWMQPGKSE